MMEASVRGRPAGKLTIRRRQVLECWIERGPMTLGQIKRVCGFQDRTAARRVLNDLKKMGLIPN